MQDYYKLKFSATQLKKLPKRQAPMTEEEQWNRLTDSEKFEDTFGRIPLLILFYVIEAFVCMTTIVLVLQCTGLMKHEIIPWSWINVMKSVLDPNKKSSLNTEQNVVIKGQEIPAELLDL